MRAGLGAPYGLDFPAWSHAADLKGIRPEFLSALLPKIENILLNAYREAKSENAGEG